MEKSAKEGARKMSLQTYFKEFNKTIKMDYDVKSELKEKRDILLGILRNDDDMPAFDEYNQGSYRLNHWIKNMI